MADAGTPSRGFGKWVVAGLVLVTGAVSLALAGTAPLRGPAKEAGKFLATNAEKPGVKTTESGLQVEMLAVGEGPTPTATDTVLVHYEGRLADGTVFDSSYQRGQPAVFGVGDVIPGWTEGLQMMRPGGKARFTIPPELGYGAQGAGGVIPPNAVLVFDVELLAIAPKQ
jgi:FKBP-type peptidyl-prolyl cis-trans isomerase